MELKKNVWGLIETRPEADIIHAMPALAKTNPYIRDREIRWRTIAEGAKNSFALEGVSGLSVDQAVDDLRRLSKMASRKRSSKGK